MVEGTGFAASDDDSRVVVRLGDEIAARDVPVNEAGRFQVKIRIERMPGDYSITVEQTDGKRLTRDRTMVKVVTSDKPERKQQGR